MSEVRENIRIRFRKEGDVRFISHHDLMRVFERALRRAEIPVAMSEGYNPRPRMSFPAALSVGQTGLNEVVDVGLSDWIRPSELRGRLQSRLPEGMSLRSIEIVSSNPNRQPTELVYRVPLLNGHGPVEPRIDELLSREEVTVLRKRKNKSKKVEIRQFIEALRFDGESLTMLLRFTNHGTARPEEVLEALGLREGEHFRAGDIERVHVRLPS